MTFEEWFNSETNEWPYPEQLGERYYECNLDPESIKSLMEEAWDAAYNDARTKWGE